MGDHASDSDDELYYTNSYGRGYHRLVAPGKGRLFYGDSELCHKPAYPGERTGERLYEGDYFEFTVETNVLFTHDGFEYLIAFYKLIDGRGWLHDFDPRDPGEPTILTGRCPDFNPLGEFECADCFRRGGPASAPLCQLPRGWVKPAEGRLPMQADATQGDATQGKLGGRGGRGEIDRPLGYMRGSGT